MGRVHQRPRTRVFSATHEPSPPHAHDSATLASRLAGTCPALSVTTSLQSENDHERCPTAPAFAAKVQRVAVVQVEHPGKRQRTLPPDPRPPRKGAARCRRGGRAPWKATTNVAIRPQPSPQRCSALSLLVPSAALTRSVTVSDSVASLALCCRLPVRKVLSSPDGPKGLFADSPLEPRRFCNFG